MVAKKNEPIARYRCTGISTFGNQGRTVSFQQLAPVSSSAGQVVVSFSISADGDKTAILLQFELDHEYELPAPIDLGIPK